MRHRIGIAGKIWLSAGVFALGYLFSTAVGQIQGLRTEGRLALTAAALFPAAQRAQAAHSDFERMTRSFADAVIVGDEAGLDRAAGQAGQVVSHFKAIASLGGLDGTERALAGEFSEDVASLAADARRFYGAMAGQTAMTDDVQQQSRAMAERTDQTLQRLTTYSERISANLRKELDELAGASARQRTTALAVFLITVLGAGALVHLTIRRAVILPVSRAVSVVSEAADCSSAAAGRVAESGEVVAGAASEQAACLEETSASLTEISATTQQTAERAAHADCLMRSAKSTVDTANVTVKELKSAMGRISTAAQEISGVLRTIDDIAFQTSILALNAAVEAARAGSAGSGFSVVAEEVRTLAGRAAEAARSSSELIEQAALRVRSGTELVERTSGAFAELSCAVIRSTDVVSEIARNSTHQSQGIEQISLAVSRMEETTQRNAANAGYTASAAAEMNAQVAATRACVDDLAAMLGLRIR